MTTLYPDDPKWSWWWEQAQGHEAAPFVSRASITPEERERDQALMDAAWGKPSITWAEFIGE